MPPFLLVDSPFTPGCVVSMGSIRCIGICNSLPVWIHLSCDLGCIIFTLIFGSGDAAAGAGPDTGWQPFPVYGYTYSFMNEYYFSGMIQIKQIGGFPNF